MKQSKKRKSHVFLDFEKKRKKRKNVTVVRCIVGLYRLNVSGLKEDHPQSVLLSSMRKLMPYTFYSNLINI